MNDLPPQHLPDAIWQMLEDDNEEEDDLVALSSRIFGTAIHAPREENKLELMIQAVVTLGAKTTEGQLIEAVGTPWFKLIAEFARDPQLMYRQDWRKWEEIIAGAYAAQGWNVTLTHRSNDGGRDVIATRHDFGSIRIIEQVKAYAPGSLVTADDVRALVGVMDMERNVSKGIVTTTSDFAPGVYLDERIKQMRPSRLDLRPGPELLKWLQSISRERASTGSLGGARLAE